MPTDALDTLTRKLEDLRLELDRLDTERTKIKQKISKLQQIAIAVGDRVRISNPTFSVYHDNIESDSLGTVSYPYVCGHRRYFEHVFVPIAFPR